MLPFWNKHTLTFCFCFSAQTHFNLSMFSLLLLPLHPSLSFALNDFVPTGDLGHTHTVCVVLHAPVLPLIGTHSVSIHANTGTHYDSIYTCIHTHTHLFLFILSNGSLAFSIGGQPTSSFLPGRASEPKHRDSFMCSGVSNVMFSGNKVQSLQDAFDLLQV